MSQDRSPFKPLNQKKSRGLVQRKGKVSSLNLDPREIKANLENLNFSENHSGTTYGGQYGVCGGEREVFRGNGGDHVLSDFEFSETLRRESRGYVAELLKVPGKRKRKRKVVPSDISMSVKVSRLSKSGTYTFGEDDFMCDSTEDAMEVEEIGEGRVVHRSMSVSARRIYSEGQVGEPLLPNTEDNGMSCIQPDTACKLIDGLYRSYYDRVLFVDCRFDYEHAGGSIKTIHPKVTCLNLTPQGIEDLLIRQDSWKQYHERVCIVFFCEFSSKRGPIGYKHLRKLDRNTNNWPHLNYPETYLLQGGYKKFFEHCGGQGYCEPDEYLTMNDERYIDLCQENIKIRGLSGRRKVKSILFSQSCGSIDFSQFM